MAGLQDVRMISSFTLLLVCFGISQTHLVPAYSLQKDKNSAFQASNNSSSIPEPLPPQTHNVCQDRYGFLPVVRFHHRACSMCYTYLFLRTKDLVVVFPYESLYHKNASVSGFLGPITPDPANETSMEEVCSTLNDGECRRWRSCCEAAMECCITQKKMPHIKEESDHCSRTWDGYSCWDDTMAGSKVSMPCPTYLENSFDTRNAVKECTVNGTWVKKKGLEWTDYRPCLDIEGLLVNVYICVGCTSASICLLLPSLIIFFLFKDLTRQHRIRLHVNFFAALFIRCLAVMLWFLLVHHEKLTNPVASEAVMIRNPIWCRVLSFFKIYLNSTTYAWMFCEGYYLHRLISRAFEPPKSLLTLYILGWGLPAIPAVVYSILRVVYNNRSCWVNNLGNLEWVLYGPNLVCLALNVIFLCNILRILLFQLHSHPHEPSTFRRGLKAGFMLIPLFGIQLVLTIYRPSATSSGNIKAYEYTTTIIINSQGICVALIFCFFNGEVLAHFHDKCRCHCCQLCLKGFGRPRSHSNPMTQMTFADDRHSPTSSLQSRTSISPKRNGNYAVDGCNDIDLCELGTRRDSSHSSLNNHHNNELTDTNTGYTSVPTESTKMNEDF